MKAPQYIWVFLLILFPRSAIAQKADTVRDPSNADVFIQKMDQYLAFRLSFNDDFQEFRLNSNGIDYVIKPNVAHMLRLSVHYRFISIAGGFAPGFIPGNDDDALKGHTKTFTLGLNLNFGHWLQGMSYEKTSGFYLANTDDYVTGWVQGTDEYIQFPDLVYNGFQGYTGYQFNNHFSSRALGSQTERQVKGAGTLITMLSYRYYIMDNQVELTGQNSSQKSNNFETMLFAGYYRTFVFIKNFYFSAGLSAGGGIIFTKLLTRYPEGEITSHYQNPIWRAEGQGALGFNSERFFAGGQLITSWTGYNQNKTSAVTLNDRLTYQVFLGYRFEAPRFVKNMTDKAEGKMKQSQNILKHNKKQK
jgi:hypothetical protein